MATILEIASEALGADKSVSEVIEGFKKTFKTIFGILCGTTVIYVISFALIMKLFSRVLN